MTTHNQAEISIDGDQWQIVCDCGWATKWRSSHGEAWEAFMVHREMARRVER